MRLAVVGSIAAMVLVSVVVARTPSHREGRRHHAQQQQQQHAVQLSRHQLDRSWNNISAFSTISDDEDILRSTTSTSNASNGGGKRKKSSTAAAAAAAAASARITTKDWGKKHKRKMASLMSIAEQDRRLSMMHLPPIPSSAHYPERQTTSALECCPTVVELVQPSGGTNMDGHVVELYRHGDLDQRIYEHSCRPDVLNQPCRFVEKLLRPLSRCVQQFSFTYAVVTDHPHSNEWRLDYIRIRNGCTCEIQPP